MNFSLHFKYRWGRVKCEINQQIDVTDQQQYARAKIKRRETQIIAKWL